MLDKVEEKTYQLRVQDTLVDRWVGSRGSLEEFSDSNCGTISGDGLVSG